MALWGPGDHRSDVISSVYLIRDFTTSVFLITGDVKLDPQSPCLIPLSLNVPLVQRGGGEYKHTLFSRTHGQATSPPWADLVHRMCFVNVNTPRSFKTVLKSPTSDGGSGEECRPDSGTLEISYATRTGRADQGRGNKSSRDESQGPQLLGPSDL